MPSKSTPTFITEIPLVASDTEEKVLLVRLEAGRQLYNACLGEAMRRVKLIRQSKAYQFAAGLPRTANNKRDILLHQPEYRYGVGLPAKQAKPGQKHGKRKLGKSIKGRRQTNQSNRYTKTRQRKANIERKLSAHRKSLQGELVNKVLSIGKFINIEKLSYRAFQKMFGASVGRRAPGMFVERLRQKAENAGGYVNEFPTQTTKLSQRCICGCIKKKPLSQRVHTCECGVVAQRDLFSANLARYVDVDGCYQAEAALNGFQSVDSLLWSAWQQAGNQYRQYSIGNPRIVNVVAAMASEKNDLKASNELDKMLDDVGNAESQQESS